MNPANTHMVYLGLGTNLGDKQKNLNDAIRMLGNQVGEVEKVSSVIETEPEGFKSDNMFLNAVVKVRTALSPFEILDITQDVEKSLGRKEKSSNGIYHDRVIDIDILLYDDINISTPRLVIPHPRMAQREFVMTPLTEIL
ncbi:MAG: 2-amino-4-hydroxy-6-hydroxymethyldihydropteridine diphosphokinase [Bacteroidales bacterium]|nr:2-amino-4-hydroxy-6-hydroxymethyldihydropteridine diphosphokinase [Bacteroidales bacterium]